MSKREKERRVKSGRHQVGIGDEKEERIRSEEKSSNGRQKIRKGREGRGVVEKGSGRGEQRR